MMWEYDVAYTFYDIARIISIITGIHIPQLPTLFLLGITTRSIPISKGIFLCNLVTVARMDVAKHWKAKDYISVAHWCKKC